MTANADDILAQTNTWRRQGKGVATATVIKTWGSSPRPAGSQLAIAADGSFVGSVSGGCIEGAVVEEALQVIADGVPRTLEYGISNETAWGVGLSCGGRVRVWVERTDADADAVLGAALVDKRSVVVAKNLATGARSLVYPFAPSTGDDAAASADESWLAEAYRAAERDRSRLLDSPDGELFLHVYNPPLRMFVVGAVHIAQSLVPMANMSGFDVIVIDPRTAFATEDRFPDVTLVHEWPDEAMQTHTLDGRSAVVTLTHDPKLDDPALRTALESKAFYIGALGSKRTHAARLHRLREQGFDDAALARIHGPIGLDIGAQSPAEIAVSIMGQVVGELRRPGRAQAT